MYWRFSLIGSFFLVFYLQGCATSNLDEERPLRRDVMFSGGQTKKFVYQVVESWGHSYLAQVEFEMENNKEWVIGFDLPYKITYLWDGEIKEETQRSDNLYHYLIKAPWYGSQNFGFLAKGDGAQDPTNVTINGASLNAVPPSATDPTPTRPEAPEGGQAATKGFFVVEGNQLKDSRGQLVRFTGVNWFGFETSSKVVHGLGQRDYKSMLKQIKAVGFNVLRIPWANAILAGDARPSTIDFTKTDPYDGTHPINKDLENKSSLEVLDAVIREAGKLGLRIILDNHTRKPDAWQSESLWYTPEIPEKKWIEDWLVVAERYQGNATVIGFDLDNEPHGEATWTDDNSPLNWKAAAERCGNAILAVNPDVLIIVEGIERVDGDSYWWGGNLMGVRQYPLRLSNNRKLMYSAHEYGPRVWNQPWFNDSQFPSNMLSLWQKHFGFIMDEKIGYVLVGEFGIEQENTNGGKDGIWFKEFLRYMGSRYSWTFWSWNPDSGDTGGILQDDWSSLNQWKVDYLKPHLAPLLPKD
jgi:aryl-phospho-beta-D-glucosidase BglC (GH1 family)